jgi:hypothetical protein
VSDLAAEFSAWPAISISSIFAHAQYIFEKKVEYRNHLKRLAATANMIEIKQRRRKQAKFALWISADLDPGDSAADAYGRQRDLVESCSVIEATKGGAAS